MSDRGAQRLAIDLSAVEAFLDLYAGPVTTESAVRRMLRLPVYRGMATAVLVPAPALRLHSQHRSAAELQSRQTCVAVAAGRRVTSTSSRRSCLSLHHADRSSLRIGEGL